MLRGYLTVYSTFPVLYLKMFYANLPIFAKSAVESNFVITSRKSCCYLCHCQMCMCVCVCVCVCVGVCVCVMCDVCVLGCVCVVCWSACRQFEPAGTISCSINNKSLADIWQNIGTTGQFCCVCVCDLPWPFNLYIRPIWPVLNANL